MTYQFHYWININTNTHSINLKGACIYHAGPIVKKNGEKYELISCGPTTSNRMNSLENEFLKITKAKIVIGKGGMKKEMEEACIKNCAIHCSFLGGCGVLASQMIEEVVDVDYIDLGMAEALWKFKVNEFGPLIVSIDTFGNNLFENNKKIFEKRRNELL